MIDKNDKNILSNDMLVDAVASSLTIVYGVISLVSKKSINSKSIQEINLSEDRLNEGIVIKKRGDKYIISVYVAVSKDVKKEEVETQIITQIIYDLGKKYKIKPSNISVIPNSLVK